MHSLVRCCETHPQTSGRTFCRGMLLGVCWDDSEPQAIHFVESHLIKKRGWAVHFVEIDLNMQPNFWPEKRTKGHARCTGIDVHPGKYYSVVLSACPLLYRRDFL